MMLGLVSSTTNKMKSYIGILNGRKGFQKDMDTFNIVDAADVIKVESWELRVENFLIIIKTSSFMLFLILIL